MRNLGVALAGGHGSRRVDDFYPTPPEATEALMLRVGRFITQDVHEPACGDGAMASVIASFGHDVIATDLVDRGYGEGGIDFMAGPPRARSIITNPPFKLAAKFIEHALRYDPAFLALLLKSTFWNADTRADLLLRYPPKRVLPLTWRLDFTGGGAPTMDCTWFVWGSAIPDFTPMVPLRRPPGLFE